MEEGGMNGSAVSERDTVAVTHKRFMFHHKETTMRWQSRERPDVFLVISLLVLFSAGCGDDGSSTGPEGPSDNGQVTIVFNEINYNSSDDFDPEDWVELCNTGANTVDLSGWIFMDEDDAHVFILPDSTVIAPQGFLVLSTDTTAFHEVFPDVSVYVGDFPFGLSGRGELIRFFNAEGELIDQVNYDDSAPWPEEPDGNGATLGLVNPARDNELAENWAASYGHGTPGEVNDVYAE